MTDKLRGLLSELAAEDTQFKGSARVLSDSGANVGAILHEVDTSVLAMELKFDGGPVQLSLLAAGRRLHRVISASKSLNASTSLLGSGLSMEDTSGREALAALISGFVSEAQHLTVTYVRSEDLNADAPEGISVGGLSDDLGLTPDIDDADRPPVERLMARAGDAVQASIVLNDGVVGETTGSNSDIAGLRIAVSSQVSSFLSTRKENCPSHTDPSMTFLVDGAGPNQGIGVAKMGEVALVFLASSSEYHRIFSAFQRLN